MPYKDPKKAIANALAYKTAHPEQTKATARKGSAAYRLRKGKAEIAEQRRRLRLSRLTERREKERVQKQMQRQATPERFKETQRRYTRTHPEYQKQYVQTHPEIIQAQGRRRRALKLNAPVNDLTAIQWDAIKKHYGSKCAYCGKKPKRLTMDHIQPLSKGGSHTLANIVPACGSCNSRKGNRRVLAPVQPLLLL